MPTPFELTTISGSDLANVRRALTRSVGFYTIPNLAALAATDVPGEVKEIVILGARTPGDAGPPMTVRRTNAPITAHAGWVRSIDRYMLAQNVIVNGDFSDPDPSDFTLSNASIGGGVLNVVHGGAFLQQSNTLIAGATYNIWIDYTATAEAYSFAIKTEANNTLFISDPLNKDGSVHTVTGSFVADGTTFILTVSGSIFTGTVDNLVLSPVNFPLEGVPIVSASNGGYWEYISTNQPIYTEWFGSKADYTSESGSGTSLLDALNKVVEFMTVWRPTVSLGGATLSGATIQLGYGNYYLPDKFRPNKAIVLQGMGHGLTEGNTRVYVAAGKTAVHADAMLTAHGSPSIFRNISFISRGTGGQTDKHGFVMEAPCVIEGCTFSGFGGNGISVAADINGGTNANVWRVRNCDIIGNAVDGIFVDGGDANAGSSQDCNFIGNGRWGLNDDSFLGNGHGPHHFDNNGTLEFGGPYRIAALGCSAVGCYTEGGQAPAYIGAGSISIGGFQGSGWTVDGGGVLLGNVFHGGFSIAPPTSQVAADKIGLGFRGVANTFYSMNCSSHTYDFRYIQDQGFVLHYDNLAGDYAYGITPPEGSTARLPRIPRNEFFIPKRMYLGGGYGAMRQLSYEFAPPTYAAFPYYPGDIAFNSGGTFAGRMCTAAGVNIPTTWTSGTAYQVGVLLRTPGGKTYRCTRLPYDPDAWTMPGSTIMPTHTTGAVAYPEPNPQIDLGEGTTIPGYTWLVVDSWYAKFPWKSGTIYGAGGSAIYDAANNRYYQCTVVPTRPTPIFNQVWSMPNSTVEPTHTSGAVEVREPNPSPSGSEPATIPGYVWDYEGNLPQTPTWANFGDLFADGTLTGLNLPSIADGSRSAVQTMTVTGAALGDLSVTVVPIDTSLQGLEVSAWVDSANTVKFQVYNRTGAAIDLPSSDWYGRVRKRSM